MILPMYNLCPGITLHSADSMIVSWLNNFDEFAFRVPVSEVRSCLGVFDFKCSAMALHMM